MLGAIGSDIGLSGLSGQSYYAYTLLPVRYASVLRAHDQRTIDAITVILEG